MTPARGQMLVMLEIRQKEAIYKEIITKYKITCCTFSEETWQWQFCLRHIKFPKIPATTADTQGGSAVHALLFHFTFEINIL